MDLVMSNMNEAESEINKLGLQDDIKKLHKEQDRSYSPR